VPLSDREQRILEEIEKNLYGEDASGARLRRGPLSRSSKLKLGAALVVVGFGLLIAFFISRSLFLGVLAFGAMVGGIVLVAGSIRGGGAGLMSSGEGPRDRLFGALQSWEERVRRRYKRH
jgi:Protein of unknown function (DUF3040)